MSITANQVVFDFRFLDITVAHTYLLNIPWKAFQRDDLVRIDYFMESISGQEYFFNL